MNLETFCNNIRRQTGNAPDVDGATVSIGGVTVANIVDGDCIPVPMKSLIQEPLLASVVWAATNAD